MSTTELLAIFHPRTGSYFYGLKVLKEPDCLVYPARKISSSSSKVTGIKKQVSKLVLKGYVVAHIGSFAGSLKNFEVGREIGQFNGHTGKAWLYGLAQMLEKRHHVRHAVANVQSFFRRCEGEAPPIQQASSSHGSRGSSPAGHKHRTSPSEEPRRHRTHLHPSDATFMDRIHERTGFRDHRSGSQEGSYTSQPRGRPESKERQSRGHHHHHKKREHSSDQHSSRRDSSRDRKVRFMDTM